MEKIKINHQGQCSIPKGIEHQLNYVARKILESSSSYNEGLLLTHHVAQRLISLCEMKIFLEKYDNRATQGET